MKVFSRKSRNYLAGYPAKKLSGYLGNSVSGATLYFNQLSVESKTALKKDKKKAIQLPTILQSAHMNVILF